MSTTTPYIMWSYQMPVNPLTPPTEVMGVLPGLVPPQPNGLLVPNSLSNELHMQLNMQQMQLPFIPHQLYTNNLLLQTYRQRQQQQHRQQLQQHQQQLQVELQLDQKHENMSESPKLVEEQDIKIMTPIADGFKLTYRPTNYTNERHLDYDDIIKIKDNLIKRDLNYGPSGDMHLADVRGNMKNKRQYQPDNANDRDRPFDYDNVDDHDRTKLMESPQIPSFRRRRLSTYDSMNKTKRRSSPMNSNPNFSIVKKGLFTIDSILDNNNNSNDECGIDTSNDNHASDDDSAYSSLKLEKGKTTPNNNYPLQVSPMDFQQQMYEKENVSALFSPTLSIVNNLSTSFNSSLSSDHTSAKILSSPDKGRSHYPNNNNNNNSNVLSTNVRLNKGSNSILPILHSTPMNCQRHNNDHRLQTQLQHQHPHHHSGENSNLYRNKDYITNSNSNLKTNRLIPVTNNTSPYLASSASGEFSVAAPKHPYFAKGVNVNNIDDYQSHLYAAYQQHINHINHQNLLLAAQHQLPVASPQLQSLSSGSKSTSSAEELSAASSLLSRSSTILEASSLLAPPPPPSNAMPLSISMSSSSPRSSSSSSSTSASLSAQHRGNHINTLHQSNCFN